MVGDDFLLGEVYQSSPNPPPLWFLYSSAGVELASASSSVTMAQGLMARVDGLGNTYLHNSNEVYILPGFP